MKILFKAILLGMAMPISAVAQQTWIPGWQDTAPLTTPRAGAAAIEANGVIYVIGGIDGRRFLFSAEYARIQPDGSLVSWRNAPRLKEQRGFFSAVSHNGFVYAVGGGNGPNGSHLLRSVERARILPEGGLGPWKKEKHALVYPRRCAKLAVAGRYIYALGGYSGTLLDTVERAEILPDGSLGPWILEPQHLTLPRYVHAVTQTNDTLFAIGGHALSQATGQPEVEWAALNTGGEPLQWRRAPPLTTGRYGLSAITHGTHVYAIGGINNLVYLDSIEKTSVAADGALQSWQATTPLPATRADAGVVVYKDWVYLLGGTNASGYYNTASYATFNDAGDIGFLGTEGASNQQQSTVTSAPAAVISLPNEGVIAEVIDTAMYTYLRVTSPDGEEWLAAAKGGYTVNTRIRYSDGVHMTDFYSKTLQRRFAAIRFVGRVEIIEAPHL